MSKPGESFEAQVALILHSAGFVIKEQPHKVMQYGKQIGDLDVLAQDPLSGILIGVSCKDWHGQTPGSEQFSHLIEMLEFEDLKYGIFAASGSIADTLPPRARHVKEKKGMNVILLDYEEISKLKNLAYSQKNWEIEEYFRSMLGLAASKRPTIGDNIRAQKSVGLGRTIECDKMIPVNYYDEPPEYVVNRDIIGNSSNAELHLDPYLIVDYSLHVSASHPGTGEILEERSDNDIVIVDAQKNQMLAENDPIFKHIQKYYTNAEIHVRVQEKGFTVKKSEPEINDKEFVHYLRDKIASQNEIRVNYTNAKGEKKQIIKRPRPDDVRILGKHIIYVPTWDVSFRLGDKSYRRVYFGYDGSWLYDEMAKCSLCRNTTIAICTECHATCCDKHSRACKKCEKILCEKSSNICIDCMTSFCSEHTPKTKCGICRSTLCENCSTISCKGCQTVVCSSHRQKCVECSSYVCSQHLTSKKFALVTKNFCSQSCLNNYDESYKSQGMFGKFKKIIKK